MHDYLSLSDQQLIDYLVGDYTPNELPPPPRLLPDSLSKRLIGSSRAHALREGLVFRNFIWNSSKLNEYSVLLDIGTGWARIPQVFMNKINSSCLFAYEPPGWVFDECSPLGYPFKYIQSSEIGGLVHQSGSVQLVTAFSIFTHLSPVASNEWLKEISRVLSIGGYCALTLQGDSFLRDLEASIRNDNSRLNDWTNYIATKCTELYGSIVDAQRAVDTGDRVFIGPYRGKYYGDHFCGLESFLRDLPPDLKLIKYAASGIGVLAQDALLLKKVS